jgi:hypothetical protein
MVSDGAHTIEVVEVLDHCHGFQLSSGSVREERWRARPYGVEVIVTR